MYWEIIIPILTLLIGWFLREISDLIKAYKEQRQEVNKAIADLLEVHRRINNYEKIVDAFQSELGFNEKQTAPIREELLEDYFVNEVRERFEKTIINISSFDPILASRLRTQANVGQVLKGTNQAMNYDERPGSKAMLNMESEIIDITNENLEEAILKLAKKSGIKTKEIKEIFKSRPELSDSSRRILEAVKSPFTEENDKSLD